MIYVKCWLMSPRSGGRAKIKTKIKVVSFSSARFQHRLYFQHGFSTVSARIENGESSVRTKRAQNAHKRLVLIFFGKFSFFGADLTACF